MPANLRVGIIGTGAIANLHARAWNNIGCPITACSNRTESKGREFAQRFGAEFVPAYEDLCRHPKVDIVDVCTFPDIRLQPLLICAETKKHIQVQKPISTNLATARQMIDAARNAKIQLSVVSQHRFDDACLFLSNAIAQGRLGRLLQCDCYVKWYRSPAYYSRPIKGSWSTEGGGALINQAIHQIDILRWIAGPIRELSGVWQLGALHKIESEDVVNAVVRYASGATGVMQASTAFWPGYTERTEFHGTKGSAIISGDRLTAWDVQDDSGDPPPPIAANVSSGSSDPMAISVEPFERQFRDFTDAIRHNRKPLISGEEGFQALEIVLAVYESCRNNQKVIL
jgi:UDP-N-acetyl-2-amino-2-deoxyglucuronate dehydrogenase